MSPLIDPSTDLLGRLQGPADERRHVRGRPGDGGHELRECTPPSFILSPSRSTLCEHGLTGPLCALQAFMTVLRMCPLRSAARAPLTDQRIAGQNKQQSYQQLLVNVRCVAFLLLFAVVSVS